ncbi:MAG: protein-L-isoaspartate(D-aspartate) O-methyltransferase [Pirellulales bacterium]|nr:protein-L-isoaspartate(D-aspartate) O-methyltransferase [Pirellulales bacterium]
MSSLRASMVDDQLVRRGISDPRVLWAMRRVPREHFVPDNMRHRAYDDGALAIPCNQTISQPLIVALMSESIAITGGERILEIGTGSGYQTAILAEMLCPGGTIWSIERHPELSRTAGEKLSALGYGSVRLHVGDGSLGLVDSAPFDAILVAAAAARCPPALWEQLRIGGRIVIPLGTSEQQQLMVLVKGASGDPISQIGIPCRFVPLLGAGI